MIWNQERSSQMLGAAPRGWPRAFSGVRASGNKQQVPLLAHSLGEREERSCFLMWDEGRDGSRCQAGGMG